MTEEIPVQVAALNFCTAAAEDFFTGGRMMDVWEEDARARMYGVSRQKFGTVELCQGFLTSTFVDLFSSGHSEAKSFGRMAPLAQGHAEDQEARKHALNHVCHDECLELVKSTLDNVEEIVHWDIEKGRSITRSCSARVVKKVEAETLGCCARVCGWNKVTCLSWPFLTPDQKIAWELECCSEWNVLNGSARQRMCNSVLSAKDADEVSANDVTEPQGIDTDATIIGQDSNLLWTEEGVKSDFAKQYMSMENKPKAEEPVDLLIFGLAAAFSFGLF